MKNFLICTLLIFTLKVAAQTDQEALSTLYESYRSMDKYMVDVVYTFENNAMGFGNSQKGSLAVEGDKYRLVYGETEMWVSDGKTEFIGTKEEDHSQLIYFCVGENEETILNFAHFLTFYGNDHKLLSKNGNTFHLESLGETIYIEAFVEVEGNRITNIKLIDDMKSTYTFALSNFTTNTRSITFSIDENQYREKIDERRGCN